MNSTTARAVAVLFTFGITALARAQTEPADGGAEDAPPPPPPPPPPPTLPLPPPSRPALEATDGEVVRPPASPSTQEPKDATVHWTRSKPPASDPDALEEAELGPEEAKAGSKAHLHDGGYARVAFGAAHLNASTDAGSELTGWGYSPEFWFGASPFPGLALGGTFGIVLVSNPHASVAAADSGGVGAVSGDVPGTVTYTTVGVFADYYPKPSGGFHLMGGVNYSSLQLTIDSGQSSQAATGLGVFGGLGYEFWTGRQWSVGPLVRVHWASVSDDSGTTSVLSPVLMLGITNH